MEFQREKIDYNSDEATPYIEQNDTLCGLVQGRVQEISDIPALFRPRAYLSPLERRGVDIADGAKSSPIVVTAYRELLVSGNKLFVPVCGILERPLLCRVIYIDQSETLLVALRPFEVIKD